MARIHLVNGYRGKDMKDIFYPKGDHDFPDEIAQRLIASGQAIALEERNRNRLQDFAGTPRNVAVTVEQVLSRVNDMTDEQIIELAHLNDITIPDATTRAKAIAALVEVALRPDAALTFTESKAKTPVVQHSRLAEDEQQCLLMLNDAGKLDNVPHVDPNDPNALTGDNSILDQMRAGTIDFTDRTVTKALLLTFGTERGFVFEKDATKAEMIDVIQGKK